jgi:hypothetical protein
VWWEWRGKKKKIDDGERGKKAVRIAGREISSPPGRRIAYYYY